MNKLRRNHYISEILKNYGDIFNNIKLLSEAEAEFYEQKRLEYLKTFGSGVKYTNNKTKIYTSEISPGCKLCSEGSWSCLFINNKCNCNCFYCPTSQTEIDVPTTNNLDFNNPKDYIDYLKYFNFKGASLSGGEPFITYELSKQYIKEVKHHFGNDIYFWIYTNGTLVTEDKLKEINDLGIDEIRFDIGANNYNLQKVKLASKIIKNVTIEIPAVPEDTEKLKNLLPEIKESGVKFLNLHQLRLTNYNFEKLNKRNYTYLINSKLTVLESELAAFEIIKENLEKNIDLSVNYCSFIYKNTFQHLAARNRAVEILTKKHENITDKAFIRVLYIEGEIDFLKNLTSFFSNENSYYLNIYTKKLYLNLVELPKLFNKIDELVLCYHTVLVSDKVNYSKITKEIAINENKKIYVERFQASKETILEKTEIEEFYNFVTNKTNTINLSEEFLLSINNFEKFEIGLQRYL